MPSYRLTRLLLFMGFVFTAPVIMRPVRSQSCLAVRRLSTLVLLLLAAFAILFPGTLSHVVHCLGMERGMNLFVYALVVTFFAQLVSFHRKEAAQGRRIATLARAVTLADVDENKPDSTFHTGVEGSYNDEEHRECMG